MSPSLCGAASGLTLCLAIASTVVVRPASPGAGPYYPDPPTTHAADVASPCPEPGPRETALWMQARASLDAVIRERRSGTHTYELTVRERRIAAGQSDTPWQTVRTITVGARDVAMVGPMGAETARDRPSPLATLLRADFTTRYCLAARDSEPGMPELTGLSFAPRAADGPSIAGTLWLDVASGAVRQLELRTPASRDSTGREVTYHAWFRGLRDGAWIPVRWHRREPLPAASPGAAVGGPAGSAVEVSNRVDTSHGTAAREVVVEVTAVTDSAGHALLPAAFPVLEGQVFDSTRALPLAGARVTLLGTQRVAVTDSAGWFLLTALPTGGYTVEVTHPRLDSLGIAWLRAETVLERGDVVYGDFAVPSLSSIVDQGCRSGTMPPGSGAVLGRVTVGQHGSGDSDARVLITWTVPGLAYPERRAPPREIRLLERTTPAGHYLLCGIPTDRPLSLWAVGRASLSDTLRLRLSAGEVRLASLRLRPVLAGSIRGQVVDRLSLLPIRGARVDLAAAGLERTTAADGRFAFDDVPAGRYVLSAVANGHAPVRRRIQVQPDDTALARLPMARARQASAPDRPQP